MYSKNLKGFAGFLLLSHSMDMGVNIASYGGIIKKPSVGMFAGQSF